MPPGHRDDLAALALLDEPVRGALYEWVVAQARPVGRQEAATALGIGRPLATFHLDRLAESGLLDAGYRRLNERRGPGAGRPARVYWRSSREFGVSVPDRRYELAARVLADAVARSPRSASAAAREAGRAAGRRIGEAVRRTSRGRRPGPVLRTALASQGYEPVVGADRVVRLRNCPFDALVEDHRPVVCAMNLAVAEGMSAAIGSTVGHRAVLDPRPGHCCVAFVPAD